MSNLLDAEPPNRLRQLDGKDDPKHVPSEAARIEKALGFLMWILVAPPDQQHLHIPHCCGNVLDELRTILKQVTHVCPRNSHWPVPYKVKIRTRSWIGDTISSSKKVKASVSGKLSPGSAWFAAVNRKGSFGSCALARSFASCKQFSEIGRPGSSQSFSGARPKLVFWKAWLSRPPGIGDFCCGLLQCRTSLPCNKNNPEITSLTCKRPLRERDEKKAWSGILHPC